MTHHFHKLALAVATLGLAAACTNNIEPSGPIAAGEKTDAQRAMPWSSNDDPRIFSNDLTYTLSDLPREGETERPPWAGSYWPVYEDSINKKWDGNNPAPSTKYGQAFGVTGVEDAVSEMRGIAGQSHRTACTESSECDSDIGEQCAKREGEESGFCVPTWFGICHAWAPASLLVPEPKHPVTYNGVEFKVNDIKALVTLAHDRVVNRFASGRCNDNDGAGDIEYDEHGRPIEGDCIDTNPGTFHILLSNYLGMQGTGFVYDRTYDLEVWNQPIRSYRVTEMNEVTGLEANELVGVTTVGGTTTTHNDQHVERGAWQQFEAVEVEPGSHVTVRITGSGDADLFVNVGAPADGDNYVCRPYASGSNETCEVDVPADQNQLFVAVNGYSTSDFDLTIHSGGEAATKYLFNDRAVKWFETRLEVKYISESSTSTDGNLEDRIDQYTHTDRYHYILEVDAQGRIIGGEWLGASKRAHPDFLWLPVRHGQTTVAGGKIKYADVMMLLNRSIADDEGGEGEGEAETRTVNEAGHVDRGEFVHFGPFDTGAGTDFIARLSGNGDADLYVRKNAAPTTAAYDCRPYKNGSSEDCTLAGGGEIYVAVHGYQDSDFELEITYTTAGAGEPTPDPEPEPEPEPTTHLNASGSVQQGQMNYYSVEVVAGQSIVIRTQAQNDIDLYVREGARPTTSEYAANGYTASGNETVNFTATQTGTLHIGVHGYAAGSYTVTTADQ